MSYLPQVAWTTIVRNVIMLSSNTYRITISPLNPNEPGANLHDISIGYYLKDYAGYTFTIIGVFVDGDIDNVIVSDDLPCGFGPQSGQYAYVYKSVGDGDAPFLAPIRHQRLDNSALDYSRAIELDILWKNRFKGLSLDMPFEFRDVTGGVAAEYDIDIKATFGYTIESAIIETDNGTLTGVNVKIGSNVISGLNNITVDTLVDETESTGDKIVVLGDRVKLFITTGYTGTPTLIRGKFKIILT